MHHAIIFVLFKFQPFQKIWISMLNSSNVKVISGQDVFQLYLKAKMFTRVVKSSQQVADIV